MQLAGRVAIITGAGRGLGRAIATRLAAEGASLLLTARTGPDLADLEASLVATCQPGQLIAILAADLAAPDTGGKLVARALAEFGRIDIVIGNAGTLGPMGPVEEINPGAFESVFACNLFGHVRLCQAAVPHLRAQGVGKIILVSGGGATAPLPGFTAYGSSKAALVRFAETLACELADCGIGVNALAPGILDTAMTKAVLAAGAGRTGEAFVAKLARELPHAEETLAAAVDLALFLASDTSNGITGKLISAKWDNWRAWPQHRATLMTSDAYTLRRIIGRDRGLPWGDSE